MSKQLYEEALADVKKLKQVAEDNAKRALVEAVTPRIRDLIERELLNRDDELEQDVSGALGTPDLPGNLVTDDSPLGAVPTAGDSQVIAAAISTPDAEGKVTLDLDSLASEPSNSPATEKPSFGAPTPEEYEIDDLSVDVLQPLADVPNTETFDVHVHEAIKKFSLLKMTSRLIRETVAYNEQIAQMISNVKNMYEYVQDTVKDPAKKSLYENKLETLFQGLRKLQEQQMANKNRRKNAMNEGDVTLKLTGLPDDLDLDSVGVDLIADEGEEEGGEELDLDTGDEGGDELDLDMGDEGGEEGGDELDLSDDEEPKMESRRLSNDTIVEIDEGMLRREISRMRALREGKESVPSTKGSGPGGTVKSFGGGKDEGDPWLDGEVTTEGDGCSEEDEPLDELDEGPSASDEEGTLTFTKESDDMYEADKRRPDSDMGHDPDTVQSDVQRDLPESIRRKLAAEKKLQERARGRAFEIKSEARRARGNSRKLATLKSEYNFVARRFNESVNRAKKLSRQLSEAKSRYESRRNGVSTQLAEAKAGENLRAKLAETNLFNAKLLYTNKLLQSDAFSKKQKAEIIERLDEARSHREVKLVYESLVKTIAGTSRPLSEGTQVIGSASRTSRSASTVVNEGIETDRWARLAGITK